MRSGLRERVAGWVLFAGMNADHQDVVEFTPEHEGEPDNHDGRYVLVEEASFLALLEGEEEPVAARVIVTVGGKPLKPSFIDGLSDEDLAKINGIEGMEAVNLFTRPSSTQEVERPDELLLKRARDFVQQVHDLRAPRDIEEGDLILNVTDYLFMEQLIVDLDRALNQEEG